MVTRIEVTYITNEIMEPKTEIIETEEIRDYIEEYVVVVHKILADKLGVDPKEIKILDWEYIAK